MEEGAGDDLFPASVPDNLPQSTVKDPEIRGILNQITIAQHRLETELYLTLPAILIDEDIKDSSTEEKRDETIDWYASELRSKKQNRNTIARRSGMSIATEEEDKDRRLTMPRERQSSQRDSILAGGADPTAFENVINQSLTRKRASH